MEGFFVLQPSPPRNSSLASYFAYKILAVKNPLRQGIWQDAVVWIKSLTCASSVSSEHFPHKTEKMPNISD